jgi:hypothetical protein
VVDVSRRLSAPSLAGVLGWGLALFGFVVGCRPFADNSLFTHLATGRLILEQGIPRADPYSFTAPGEPWVVQSWLVSAVYGVVERFGGLGGVRVLAGLLVGALMALMWRLTAPAGTLLPRVGLLAVAMVAGAPFWVPRPLLLGLVLLALLLVVVTEERDPRWLVPIMWLWVNSHGSFVLGVLAVAALAAGRWLDGNRDRALWRPLGWCLAGTLLGGVNPLGPVLLAFPVHLLGRMEILSRVLEWRSPDFATVFARAFLVEVSAAVLVLVRRPSFRLAVPLVVFTAAGLQGQRSIAQSSLVILAVTAPALAGLGSLDGARRSPALAGAAAVFAVLAVVAASVVLDQPDVDLRGYPTDGLAWLDQHGQLTTAARVAHEDTAGNLLSLLRGTDGRVFFDDRYDMYPLAMSRDYLEIHDGLPGWQRALDDRGVRALLWPRSSPVAGLVTSSRQWRVVYQDPGYVLACRRVSERSEC